MAMQAVYLVAAKNLSKFLDALRHAQAPPKLNLKFVDELGFSSTNDRLFVPLLRAMRFIDEGGKPTARYHSFLDGTQWKVVLAEGIRDAYPDLFRVNRHANTMTREQLAGKIRSLSEGRASDSVVTNTVKTFVELVKLADFSGQSEAPAVDDGAPSNVEAVPAPAETVRSATSVADTTTESGGLATLVYRIEIVLPAVRDQAVYDAIFRSARAHLLK
jgi:hypothetical protein